MKKYLTIVLGILLALLCASSCGKQGTDEEPNVGAGKRYKCSDIETGINWTLSFSSNNTFNVIGRTSKGVFAGDGFYYRYGYNQNDFHFNDTIVNVPADKSQSGQKEQHLFLSGMMIDQTIERNYKFKVDDGDWSGVKALTFK